MANLKILQWNCQSIRNKIADLKILLSQCENPPQILCIQETFLNCKTTINIPGYSIIYKNRKDDKGKGDVASAIKNGISYTVEENKLEELIVIKIKMQNSYINIINLYKSLKADLNIEELASLTDNKNTMLIIDFNSHNPLWSSK